jgi:hypothetical protein
MILPGLIVRSPISRVRPAHDGNAARRQDFGGRGTCPLFGKPRSTLDDLLDLQFGFGRAKAQFGRPAHILRAFRAFKQRGRSQGLADAISRLRTIAIGKGHAGAEAARIESQIDTERPGTDYAKVRRCGHEPDSAAG